MFVVLRQFPCDVTPTSSNTTSRAGGDEEPRCCCVVCVRGNCDQKCNINSGLRSVFHAFSSVDDVTRSHGLLLAQRHCVNLGASGARCATSKALHDGRNLKLLVACVCASSTTINGGHRSRSRTLCTHTVGAQGSRQPRLLCGVLPRIHAWIFVPWKEGFQIYWTLL